MKRLFVGAWKASLVAAMITTSWAGSAAAQAAPEEQCSLAIVSRLAANDQKVCDGKLVKDLAERGHAFEQNQLGIASVLAVGPDYTDTEALKWFTRAAQKGYAPAQVNLAVMYANGWGTTPNYGAALNWLHAAAAQRFARAYTNLGILYLNGKGVRQDYTEAVRWFQLGADAGDSDAQTNLAYMFGNGLGCNKDLDGELAWYRKAAAAGNPLAESNLADIYLRGDGVAQNASEAFRLFQRAADRGHSGARIMLGSMYGNAGFTFPVDTKSGRAAGPMKRAFLGGGKMIPQLITRTRQSAPLSRCVTLMSVCGNTTQWSRDIPIWTWRKLLRRQLRSFRISTSEKSSWV